MKKKIVLAFSGGLDTSIILKWLQNEYDAKLLLSQQISDRVLKLRMLRKKLRSWVLKIFVEDLQDEFVREYVFPMFRANTLYEGCYLLGTSIARPLIAKDK